MPEYLTILPPFAPPFIDELSTLASDIFGAFDRDELIWRITHMPDPSVHLARDSELVGFKLGYASARRRYHSWLGGVRAGWRRQGIAQALMAQQHDWLRARGYASVETAMMPDNVAMLALNMQVGFRIIGSRSQGEHTRVILAKSLTADG